VFPVRYGQTYRVELSFKLKTGKGIMSRTVVVILKYHRHKHMEPEVYTITMLKKRPGPNEVLSSN
jgi:hypothetical protein